MNVIHNINISKKYKYKNISNYSDEKLLKMLNNWVDHFPSWKEREKFIQNNLVLISENESMNYLWES